MKIVNNSTFFFISYLIFRQGYYWTVDEPHDTRLGAVMHVTCHECGCWTQDLVVGS